LIKIYWKARCRKRQGEKWAASEEEEEKEKKRRESNRMRKLKLVPN